VLFPSSGSYEVTLTATGEFVWPNSISETVIVSDELLLELDMPEPQCQVGNSSSFIPTGNWAEPANFAWIIDNGIDFDPNTPTQNNISVSSGGNHGVELTIIDANDCELTVTGQFQTVDPLNVSFETNGTGCIPYSAYFDNNTTGGAGLEFLWNFGDGTTGTEVSPYHNYNNVGTFDVSLTANSTIGCIETQTFLAEEVLSTFPTPEVGFTMNPLNLTLINPVVNVETYVEAEECNFYVSDGTVFEDCSFSHTFDQGGLFDITQYVTNEFGCSKSTTQTLRVTGHLFYAPTAVTMNDDGTNDFFKTSLLGDIVEYEMIIYDRYGRIVFTTEDPKEHWKPEYSHDGLFNFQVRVRDNLNIPSVYEGSFITIR